MTAATLDVDLAALKGWARQVDRASSDLQGLARNGDNHLIVSDFGPILEVMMGSYNRLLPMVTQTLTGDGAGVQDHAEALRAVIGDYEQTEEGIVTRHRGAWGDSATTSSGFHDVADTAVPKARPTEGELPKVSFGQPYDIVCDLVRVLTGFDIRAELAEKISGDVVGASTQGSSMSGLGSAMTAVATNLSAGQEAIASSWSGQAADAALGNIGRWIGQLDEQAVRLIQMGQNLIQTCRNAWETASSVVQCIKSAVQTVSSALATASIPGVGWARIAQAVFQAFQSVLKALQMIKKFIGILQQLVSLIDQVGSVFDAKKLPSSDRSAATTTGPAQAVRAPESVATPTVGSADVAVS